MRFSAILPRNWTGDQVLYITLNIAISGLGFLRSFIFLKSMGYYELGIVSIFQTIIMLLSLTQFGTVNGAYRAFSGNKKFTRPAINNFVFTFFLLMSVVCMVPVLINFFTDKSSETLTFMVAVLAGILALMTNYLNNSLLADTRIKDVNRLNLISNGLGFSCLFLMVYHPLLGLLTFIVQPAVFIIGAFVVSPSLIPRRISFSANVLKLLLALGFIPYLTSLFTYLNQQVERWTIVYTLGIEQFGHFYLVVAFASVYALFPNSVNNLYFARMVRAYSEKDSELFARLLRNYNIILVGYSIAAIVVTLALAPIVVEWLFPQHLDSLVYVYCTLPGLVALSAANPYVVYFNASLRLSPLLIAYGVSSVITILAMLVLYWNTSISLRSVAMVDSLGNLAVCALMIFFFFRYRAMERAGANGKIV
jgi:O-antigen/teichoic acid export membrane protein